MRSRDASLTLLLAGISAGGYAACGHEMLVSNLDEQPGVLSSVVWTCGHEIMRIRSWMVTDETVCTTSRKEKQAQSICPVANTSVFRHWQIMFLSGDAAYERYPSALEVPWNYYEGCDAFFPVNAKPARVAQDTLVFLYEVGALDVVGDCPCFGLT